MCSLAARRCGSNLRRLGSSRLLSRRGLNPSPNSSRETLIAAAETREGRGQKAHVVPCRVLSNSTKLRNGKAARVASCAKVVSSAKSAKFALSSR